MSIIESLILSPSNETKDIKNPKVKENFLLELIKSYKDEPQKLIDLLKNLNIDKKDLQNLLNKNNNTDDKEILSILEKIKNLLKNNTTNVKNTPDIDKVKKTPVKLEKNTKIKQSHEESILQKLITKPVSNEKLQKTVEKKLNKKIESEITSLSNQNIPQQVNITHLEEKIVSFTKKLISSKIKVQNIKLSDKDIQTFKEIKTFKELIDFANKKNLNISKIVLSHFNEKKQPIKNFIELPKNKIVLKTKLPKNINIKNSSDNNIIKHQENKNNILNSLLKNEDTSIQTKKENIIHSSHTTHEKDEQNVQITPNNFNIDSLKQNIHKAKESIKHFATDLKEAVENYKPPISKLSMELHPKELGKVEVTIVHRGDNLQIQINSNNTAVGFFHSTQQELRQNLINMGFTDVNMSFNQQQQQGNKQYRQNQKFANNNDENDELIIEIPYQYA